MTSAMFGVGRLAMWEQAALGARLSLADTLGTWDAAGAFHPNSGGYHEDELRLEPYALLRLAPSLELSASLPAVATARGVGDAGGAGAALGDAQGSLRWQIADERAAGAWPTVAVIGSALFATGRRPEEARAPLATDATSRGAFGAGAALSADKTLGAFFAHADLGATAYMPFHVKGGVEALGPTAAAGVSAGAEVAGGVVVGGSAGIVWDAPYTLDGKVAEGSNALVVSAGALASWKVDPHWTLLVGLSSGVPLSHAGMNRPASASASAALRFGFF